MPITVVTGPPGAGKTTISAALARSKQRGVHLPTDHWYHWIVAGYVPPWKPQANTQNTTVIEAIASSAEYDCLVGPLLHKLHDGASPTDLVDWIGREQREHFGMTPNVASDAALMVELVEWWQAKTVIPPQRCTSLSNPPVMVTASGPFRTAAGLGSGRSESRCRG